MDNHYYARVRALELALQLSGSHKYKMAKAEEFYQFLAQGIGIGGYYYNPYSNGLILNASSSPTTPFTLTADQTVTNNG